MSRFRTAIALLFALSLFVVACDGASSDSDDVGVGFGDTGDPGFPDTLDDLGFVQGDAKDAGPQPDQEDVVDEGHRYHIVCLEADDPVLVPVGGSKVIKFQVIDLTADTIAGDVLIRPQLTATDPTTGASGQLDAQMFFSGHESGIGEVNFRAGDVAPATYTLRAHVEGATQDAEIEIQVTESPMGNIRVQLAYQGELALHDIQVYLHPAGYYVCSQFNPASPWPADHQLEALTTNSGVLFEDLAAETDYVAFVTARGPNGSLAGYGCADGIFVQTDQTRTTTVELYTLVLNPAGLYDMEAVFDFTGAIPGEVGRIVDLVVNLFYSPGDFAFDLIDLVIDYYFGQAIGTIVDWVVGLFRDYLVEFMNDWLLNESPDWVQDFFTIGQDLTQIIGRMTLLANLRIAKVMNEQTVNGQENWIGLALYWRLGCPDEDEPDYDPECGRWDISLDEIQNTAFPLDLITGYWTGNINNFDHLSIEPHGIQLNYGRLILFVINEMLLPWINPDYHDLTDLILGVVDCDGMADGVVGDLLDNLGIERDDVRDFCVSSITTVVDPIILIVYGLGADSHLRLYGDATLVDETNNLVVDEIIDGSFTGHIEMGTGEQGQEFEATWDAVRQ